MTPGFRHEKALVSPGIHVLAQGRRSQADLVVGILELKSKNNHISRTYLA
jgi:hypothetical protein